MKSQSLKQKRFTDSEQSGTLIYYYPAEGGDVEKVMDVTLSITTTSDELADKLSRQITGTSSYVKTMGDAAFTLDAVLSAGSGLTYNSSDVNVVTVSENGMVTLVGAGTSQITVTAAETAVYKSASLTVTVTVQKGSQEITGTVSYVKTMGEAEFTLDSASSVGAALTYASSDAGVAAVSSNGTVTLVGVGTTQITVTAAETSAYYSATTTIIVTVQEAASGSIGENNSEGDTLTDSATDDGTTGSFAAVGTAYSDDTAKYTVTASGEDEKTVTVTAPLGKTVTGITIPATVTIEGTVYRVTAIADNAFANCTKLKKVTIGENITSIGKKAFYKCTSLTKVSGFASVVSIGNSAFYGCKKLATISLKTTKLKKSGVKANAFKGVKKTCTFKVPAAKVSAYKKIFKARGAGSKIKVMKL